MRAPVALYFHSACVDGLVSAALCTWLRLHEDPAHAFEAWEPVDYLSKDVWRQRDLGPHAAVVDFLFHPGATWWFDHHGSTFGNSGPPLAPPPGDERVWI